MNRSSWLLLALLALLSGCRADSTGADTRRYPCGQDAECATGYACLAGVCQRPGTPPLPDAGEDSGTPGDGGADTDAGGPVDDGGMDAGSSGPPTQLVFVTGAQTLETGQCSSAAILETQTAAGGAAPVGSRLTVTLSAQPAAGVTFYQDASCTSTTSSVAVAAGTSRATFYFRGSTVQPVRVIAAAPGLTTAQQDESVVPIGPPASAVFVSSAQTVPTSGCSAKVELELRDTAGLATSYSTAKSTPLAGDSGLTFYSDSACTTAITDAPFAANATRTSFYFKGKTSGPAVRVTATVSGLAPVSQDEFILPIVRAGLCTLPSNSTSVTCPIAPAQTDLAKTMLLFQASPSGNSPNSTSVRCWMSAKDAFTCGRNAIGSKDVPITWKTVELASGLKVQHLQPPCSSSATLLPVSIASVAMATSFLLVSSEVDGTDLAANDFFTAKLVSSTRVEFQFSAACSTAWKGALQVVQLDGARVVRGSGAFATNQDNGTNAGLTSASLATTALLYNYRVSNASTVNLCDRVVRGDLPVTTEVRFTRGLGAGSGCLTAAVDEIAWERIDFSALARVQPVSVSLGLGGTDITADFATAVDPTRSVLFSGGQVMNGQAMGESNYSGDDILGEATARFEFVNPTASTSTLRITRDSAKGAARFAAFVVQFEP